MSAITNSFNNLVEQKLLNLHTAFLSSVISYNANNNTATVQPLALQKQVNKPAAKQAILSNIPVAKNARFVIDMSANTDETVFLQGRPLQAGDTVICIACERDISAAKKGKMAVPPIGHHQIKDAVVIGVI